MEIANLRISVKLPVVIIALSLVAAMATGVASYFRASSALEQEAFAKLAGVRSGKVSEITNYLLSIDQDLKVMATNHMVIDGIKDLEDAYTELGATGPAGLQKAYIADNPNPTGEKHKMDKAKDGSKYSEFHAKYHPWFRQLLEERGYYDIFLVNEHGDIVYTVFKEADFATNLANGQWKDTDLGKLFAAVEKNRKLGSVFFSDLAPYVPSDNVPASFIATPVFEHGGEFHGALIFQMPVERITKIMRASEGLGKTGEAYLVGADKLMRSDSRFVKEKETSILKTKVDNASVDGAIAGKTDVVLTTDYHGAAVMAAYAPIKFHGVTWAVIAEMDKNEVFAPVAAMRNIMLLIVGGVGLAVTAIGFYFARHLTKPINAMTGAMGDLAGGNLQTEIPALDKKDEIGEMAKAVQVFKENMIKNEQLAAEQKREQEARNARAAKVDAMTKEFDTSVAGVLNAVAAATTELESTATAMSGTAEETSKQATAVAAASEEASANVQTVASAAEELSASISEISNQVSQAAKVSASAVEEANRADGMVQGLAQSAQKIGEVVELITSIADQTNLLALNATIEAARAGEAGKGFAVVAAEVKNLANQTAKATEEIGTQIGGIQGSTKDAVGAIQSIGKVIGEINQISSAIAAAVEEQGAATKEIARNVEQASSGTKEVSANIAGVTQAAGETGSAANQVLEASRELAQQSDKLKTMIQKFLADVRAA